MGPSAALRCCRIFCACSGSCQKLGCAVFCSSAARRSRFRETSKIAPHELHALVKFVVTLFQVFENHVHSKEAKSKLEEQILLPPKTPAGSLAASAIALHVSPFRPRL